MIYIDVAQGSPEWHAHRARRRNAGDAAAMLGCSPHESRAALLKRTHLAMSKDVSDFVQARIFDPGHRFEALARPLAESIVGEELYPVVGELDGTLLSASFDGLTLDESAAWEHKRLNADLLSVFERIANGESPRSAIPMHHRVQMEHQMIVSGAGCVLFMASEWDADGNLIDKRHCWYYPEDALRQQIIDGWAQFERDLAAYVLPEAAPAAPVGRAPETLPALRIELQGVVTASNLAEFRETALTAIRSVNRDLRTDTDFADAEKAVKWCAEVESRLKAAKEHALSQTASIDALFRTIDDISAEARTVRLDLDKLVAKRKQEVKEQAVAAARRALEQHVAALNAELAPYRMPAQDVDFAGAIKGLRSVASMQDALDSALATGKIAADAIARGIRANIATYCQHAAGMDWLFQDLPWLVLKAQDDFVATLQARIAQHKAAEERLAREKAEEAARIAAKPAAATTDQGAQAPQAATPWASAAWAPGAAQLGTPAPTHDDPPALKLGDINARLSPVRIDAAGMAQLGIQHAAVSGPAKLYRESDYRQLLEALAAHLSRLACSMEAA